MRKLFVFIALITAQSAFSMCALEVANQGYYAKVAEVVRAWTARGISSEEYVWVDAQGSVHTFRKSDVVEVAYEPFFGKTTMMSLPKMVTGRVVGTRTARNGDEFLVLDMGTAFRKYLSKSRIRNIALSTAFQPEANGLLSRVRNQGVSTAKDLARPAIITGNLVMAYYSFSFTLGSLSKGFRWVWDNTLWAAWDHVAAYSTPLAYATAAAVVYGVHRFINVPQVRDFRLALRDRVRDFHYLVTTVNLYWWRPWQIQAYWTRRDAQAQKRAFDDAFRDVEWMAEGKMPSLDTPYVSKDMPQIGPLYLADNRGYMPLWLLPGNNEQGRAEFIARAKQAYEAILQMRRHFLKLGIEQADRLLPVVISREPLVGYSAPLEREQTLSGLPPKPIGLVLAPRTLTAKERSHWENQPVARAMGLASASPEALSHYATDPAFAAYAFAKQVANRELGILGEYNLIAPALGEYFALSALAPETPELLPGALFEGHPLVSAERAAEDAASIPPHLNYNTVSQIDEDLRQSAQVLLRFLWELRRHIGQERADELAYDSAQGLMPSVTGAVGSSFLENYVGSPDILQIVRGMRVKRAKLHVYLYVARMLELCRKNPDDAELAAFVMAKAQEAGLAGAILNAIVAKYLPPATAK
ncbi:hypothetical protein K2X33_05375 [bacterium]|nr:hypothetical protein [bacterium]